jgi:hypothetical protein
METSTRTETLCTKQILPRIDIAASKYYKHNGTLINYAPKKLVVEYYQSNKFCDIESDGENPMVTAEEHRPLYQRQTRG